MFEGGGLIDADVFGVLGELSEKNLFEVRSRSFCIWLRLV